MRGRPRLKLPKPDRCAATISGRLHIVRKGLVIDAAGHISRPVLVHRCRKKDLRRSKKYLEAPGVRYKSMWRRRGIESRIETQARHIITAIVSGITCPEIVD
jgi:hypothetical protein